MYGKVFGGLRTFLCFGYFLKMEAFRSELLTSQNYPLALNQITTSFQIKLQVWHDLKVVWHICKCCSRSPWNFFCRWLLTIGCFCTLRRKRRIRENQSTATVPVLKRPPDQFAVSQLLDGNVCVYARPGARADNKSADWLFTLLLPFRTLSTPYVNLAE